jgi:hypothetical protein
MRHLALSFLLLVAPAIPVRANFITNGDFSLGNVSFSTDYGFTAVNTAAGQYTVGTNPQLFNSLGASFGDHTTGSGPMMIVNGATSPEQTVWQQTVAVDQGTSYLFSGWVASWGNRGGLNPIPASLRFFVNGTQVGSDFTAIVTDAQWSQFNVIWQSGSSTSATIRIVDVVTVFGGNDFTLDDLTFAAVPEPSSLVSAALGLAGLAGYAGWRRVALRRCSASDRAAGGLGDESDCLRGHR